MGTIITPKYDNDTITLGYLKQYLKDNGIDLKDFDVSAINKNYSTPPVPPYKKNSLLLQDGKIYKCIKDKNEGLFSWNDWIIIATDDSKVDNFIEKTYETDKIKIEEQMDNKIETYYQENDPSINWPSSLDKEKHVGDYWYNTTDKTEWRYCRNVENTIITYSWKQKDVPNTIYDMINKKKSIYTSKPISYEKDDMWIIEENISAEDIPQGTLENPIQVGDWVISVQISDVFNKDHWIKKDNNVNKEYIEEHYYTNEVINEKFEIVNSSIQADILRNKEEVILKVSQDYTTKTETETVVKDFGEQVGTITNTLEVQTNTLSQLMVEKDNINISISKIVNDGVNKVTTNTGYTFGDDGLKISKTGEEMDNTIDNKGVYVKRDNTEILGADADGVRAENVTVRKYLTVGNHARFENYGDGRTGCFYLE